MYSQTINQVKQLANQLHKTNIKYFRCPENLNHWIGLKNIYFKKKVDDKIFEKYSIIKGDITRLKEISFNTIAYDDHVSRINTKKGFLPSAIYTLPNITNEQYLSIDIKRPDPQLDSYSDTLVKENYHSVLTKISKPFSYEKMESGF